MKKILFSIAMIAAVGSAAVGASTAYFSDTETSTGNTFTAGAIDLKIDNHAWYNGQLVPESTWELTNLTIQKFFNLLDVKPGDWEEDTISLHVDDNDAYACMDVRLTKNDDVSSTEPELDDGDVAENPGNLFDGELAGATKTVWWADDGDNVLEIGEHIFFQGTLGSLNGSSFPLADSNENIWNIEQADGPIPAKETKYIGKALCFGEITLAPLPQDGLGPTSPINPGNSTGGFSCNGAPLTNVTQTDSVMGDISFTAIQSRNNPRFDCAPGQIGCLDEADVMIVFDRSGSINDEEEATMTSAAHAFVDALALSTPGVHGGLSSFGSDGTLDAHLTDDATALKAAITALTTPNDSLTNLYEGLLRAHEELTNFSGDPHDRNDAASPDIIVVLTDGNPNQPPDVVNAKAVALAEATAIKGEGTQIYVVGIGSDVDATYLKSIASSDAHYFAAANFANLSAQLADIASCGNQTN